MPQKAIECRYPTGRDDRDMCEIGLPSGGCDGFERLQRLASLIAQGRPVLSPVKHVVSFLHMRTCLEIASAIERLAVVIHQRVATLLRIRQPLFVDIPAPTPSLASVPLH